MTEPASYLPQLTREEALQLTERYDIAGDADAEMAGKAIVGGDFSPDHLRTIFRWKTRNLRQVSVGSHTNTEIRDALRLAAPGVLRPSGAFGSLLRRLGGYFVCADAD